MSTTFDEHGFAMLRGALPDRLKRMLKLSVVQLRMDIPAPDVWKGPYVVRYLREGGKEENFVVSGSLEETLCLGSK